MRNKFLKMTFMALCLSTSSALHAMNLEDEVADCSSVATYAGKYEIRNNNSSEQPSGSVTIRQEGDRLVLENFSLIAGSYYYNRMGEVIRDTNESSPFETENRQIANFVLSALPTEVIQLRFLGSPDGSVQYGSEVPFGKVSRAPMHVRFRTEKDPFYGEMFHLSVESPYGIGRPAASPVEQFRLFKVGSAEHNSLLERSMFFSSSHTVSMPSLNPLLLPSSSSDSRDSVKTTFRTAGANEAAEIKHSAIYASFSYENNQGAAYSLIINHRTNDDKGSMVRVHNPNARAYLSLGKLSPSVSFSNQVFDISSLFEAAPTSSSSTSESVMRTELNFIDGISDIHFFKIKSDGNTLIKVTLGDEGSEKQTGVYVYAPEVSAKLQEWSEVRSESVSL